MDGVPAMYNGRLVSKEHFRAFIYAPNGSQKLVESWDEFEKHMQTGLWFAQKDEACEGAISKESPKRVRKPVKASEPLVPKEELQEPVLDEPLIEEELIPVEREDLAFEVKDDFLPKARK